MKVICEYCGKEFNKPPCHVKRVNHVYCSKECYDKAQQIYPDVTCKVCGKRFRAKNHSRHSTCSKECQREARKKEDNPNWRGGVTKSRKAYMSTIEYKNWRKAVFKRDNYTCLKCGKRGGDLEAHHVKSWKDYPELRYDVINGETLCKDCHIKTYKKKRRVGIA